MYHITKIGNMNSMDRIHLALSAKCSIIPVRVCLCRSAAGSSSTPALCLTPLRQLLLKTWSVQSFKAATSNLLSCLCPHSTGVTSTRGHTRLVACSRPQIEVLIIVLQATTEPSFQALINLLWKFCYYFGAGD